METTLLPHCITLVGTAHIVCYGNAVLARGTRKHSGVGAILRLFLCQKYLSTNGYVVSCINVFP